MPLTRLTTAAWLTALILAAGCAADDATDATSAETTSTTPTSTTTRATGSSVTPTTDSPPNTSASSSPSTTASTAASSTTEVTTTSTAPPTTNAPTATTDNPTTTTTGPDDGIGAEVIDVSIDIPPGEFRRAPGDLVVLRSDGDLEYRPNGLAPAPSNRADPIMLVDRPDPRPAPSEGPGPNVVEDVAGIVNGSFIYGDCCEPISGNVFAVDTPGSEVGPIAFGFTPNLSPSGTHLAAANGMSLGVFDLAVGQGRSLLLDQHPDETFRSIIDLEWIDDDTLAAITYDGGDHHLWRYDASTLATTDRPLNLDPDTDLELVRFTGTTPDGLLSVSLTETDRVTVRYLEPTQLDEVAERQQSFPASVERIETDDDGLGQLWVDGGTLYHLPDGAFEADALLDGVLAGWFVDS